MVLRQKKKSVTGEFLDKIGLPRLDADDRVIQGYAMIKVLVADDYAIVRKEIALIIAETTDIVVTDEAKNGQEVLEKTLINDFDLVLLDISMPGRDGLEILKELKIRQPKLTVLMLSTYPEEQYAVRALRSGAAGYLTKDRAPDELITAIRKVTAGGNYVSASIAEGLGDKPESCLNQPLHNLLSDREFQIMRMMVSGKTLTAIADELSLSIETVSTYSNLVLEKMRMNSNSELMRYAIQNKLIP